MSKDQANTKAMHKSYQPLKPAANMNLLPLRRREQSSYELDKLQKERMTERERDSLHLATRLPPIARPGVVDNRNRSPQLSVNTQKSDYRRELGAADWEKRDIASFPRGENNKQVLSSTTHRSYQPLKPAANLVPMKRWEELRKQAVYEQHVEKVRNAEHEVDTNGLETPAHVKNNLKKAQLQKEKMEEIERDSLHLATRLSAVARSKGLVDNWNDRPKLSPNTLKKKQTVLELTRENEWMDQKILEQQSEYRRELWEADWEKVKDRREDIGRYPRGETKQVPSSTTHRSYQPLKPAANLLLQKRWDEAVYVQHIDKVRKAKPVVDTNGLETPAYLKKVQLQKERMKERERDSLLLATRLPPIARSEGLVDKRNHFPQLSL